MKRFLKWLPIGAAGLVVLIIVLAVTTGGDKEQARLAQQKPSPTATPTFDQLKATALSLQYKELFRDIESHRGKLVYFRGQVVQ